jgi:hypothetical protein
VSIDSGYKLLRSFPNVTALKASPNPEDGDLAWVVNSGDGNGAYYYYTTATNPDAWVKITLLTNGLLGDVNLDGTVNGADLAVLLANWGLLGQAPELRFGISDGITNAFKIFAYGFTAGKKSDIFQIATENALSTVNINSSTLDIDAFTSISGNGSISLELTNGGLQFPDGTTQGTAAYTVVGPTGPTGPTGPQGNTGATGAPAQTNSTIQTINFSELIDHLEFTISGLGLSYSASLEDANIDNITGITFDTGVANGYSGVLKSFQTFKDPPNGNTWAARIIMEPPFVGGSTTASGIIDEVINKVYIDGTFYVNFGTPEYWTNITSQNVRHKEGTYAIKTITGQTWVTANSFITCEVMGLTSTDHTPEDAILEGVKFNIYNIVAGTGFDIIGHAPEGTYGKYTVKCLGQ